MDDPVMFWIGVGLLILFIALVVIVIVISLDSNIVCEINLMDASDVFCYEPV